MPNKPLIITGLIIALIGIFWPYVSKITFGKLPGDIYIERENFGFYFPLSTSIIISILIAVIFRIISDK